MSLMKLPRTIVHFLSGRIYMCVKCASGFWKDLVRQLQSAQYGPHMLKLCETLLAKAAEASFGLCKFVFISMQKQVKVKPSPVISPTKLLGCNWE